MKKLLAILLALAMLLGALPALAANIAFEGADYDLVYESAEIVDGEAVVTISGFGSGIPLRDGRPTFVAWAWADFGDGPVRAYTVTADGGEYAFGFHEDRLPEKVWVVSGEDDTVSEQLWPAEDEPAHEPADEPADEPATDASGIRVGDTLTLGRWEQDDNSGNGPEDIRWRVLAVEGDAALLISQDALAGKRFGNSDGLTWANSEVRAWLNGEFLDGAFTADERAKLVTKTVTADANPDYGTSQGNDTEDAVFLLSIVEARKYFSYDDDRIVINSKSTVAAGTWTKPSVGSGWWWLRTMGSSGSWTAGVDAAGAINRGGNPSDGMQSVRPAVWLKLEGVAAAEPEAEPEPEEEAEAIPEELVGLWTGVGKPKNNGSSIDLTVQVNADGTGKYTFIQQGYRESNDIEITPKGNRFTVNTSGSQLSACEGTWSLEGDELVLDITSTLPGGRTYSYVARCTKEGAEEPATEEPEDETEDEVEYDRMEDYSYVTSGDYDWYFNPILFATDEDNPALLAASAADPAPEGGNLLLVRFDMMDGGATYDDILGFMGDLKLRTAKGEELEPAQAVVLFGEGTEEQNRVFDLIYVSPDAVSREDCELLCADTLYAIAQFPSEGEPLRAAYAAESAGLDGDLLEQVLDALGEETYRSTYDALRGGEVIEKGSKGDAAKGVQQTLIAFGQDIAADGSVGPKTISALNAVQAGLGLPETESLDAAGYARLLPRLLMASDEETAYNILYDTMDYDEYEYARGCALVLKGKYYHAKQAFENSSWADASERAAACVQEWPKNGQIWKNSSAKGSGVGLTVKINNMDEDQATLVKIYNSDDVLVSCLFIGGNGKASTKLGKGTYTIKEGIGSDWYGMEDAFGDDGYYKVMTFNGGDEYVTLKSGYDYTITSGSGSGDSVGSNYESYDNF